MLAEIRRLTRFVSHYEKEFASLMMGFTQQAAEGEWFARMSAKYEGEQKELRVKIKTLQDDIERTRTH